MLTINQVAKQLQLSHDAVRSLIASGDLPAANVGQGKQRASWRIQPEALDDFLARRSTRHHKMPTRKPGVKSVGNWI